MFLQLEEVIKMCIETKQGNNEFVLYYLGVDKGRYEWLAAIGNPSQHVAMLESEPEIKAKGDTPIKAALMLLSKINEVQNVSQL